MLTYEKVFELYKEYLAANQELEIVKTRRGYIMIEWAGSAPYCDEGYLCQSPEELFDRLLDDYRIFQEVQLTKGRRELTEEDVRQADILCQSYLKFREEERK